MSLKKLSKIRRGKNNTPDDVILKSRKMGFSIDEIIPRHWAGGDAVKTHFLNGISAILPQGEEYFVQTVRDNMDRITDPELAVMCRKFFGQEGHHTNEHRTFNEYLVNKQGYKHLPRLEKWMWSLVDFFSAITDDDTHLIFVSGAEHMTAVTGHQVLSEADYWLEDNNPLSSILIWHAVEEVEHKSVVYDVHDHLGGSYWKRILWMPAIVSVVATGVVANQLYMLHADGELKKPKTWWRLFNFYFGIGGVSQKLFSKEFLSYMLPSFHPWQLDDRHLIVKWEERYEAQEDLRSVVLKDVVNSASSIEAEAVCNLA